MFLLILSSKLKFHHILEIAVFLEQRIFKSHANNSVYSIKYISVYSKMKHCEASAFPLVSKDVLPRVLVGPVWKWLKKKTTAACHCLKYEVMKQKLYILRYI